MEKSRRKQVDEALAINSLGGAEPDKEFLDLMDRYANHELDYDELSNEIDEKVKRDIKNFNERDIISE